MAEAEPESLIDKNYLKEHHLKVYLEDAIAQLLTHRQEGNASPTMKPCKFFKEYFTSVHQGTHVLYREFSFVSATPYNRLCVLKTIMQIFKPLFYREEKYNVRDYHSLLKLLWPNFCLQVVEDAVNACDGDKKDDNCCIKFIDFIKALKSTFCTGDLDYEASIIDKQVTDKIEEFSRIPAQSGDMPVNLSEADFLVNVEEDSTGKTSPWSLAASKILDGSEFKRLLNLNDSNSVSSEEAISGGKLSRSSSESREVSKSAKKKKSKKGSASRGKSRGRMAGKHLSNSLNLLQSEKKPEGDGKNVKRRNRSKSAVASNRNPLRKPWR